MRHFATVSYNAYNCVILNGDLCYVLMSVMQRLKSDNPPHIVPFYKTFSDGSYEDTILNISEIKEIKPVTLRDMDNYRSIGHTIPSLVEI